MNNLAEKLNKNNIFNFIDAVFTPTFHETNNEVTKSPPWFLYLVNYWNDKEEVLNLLEYVGIEIPGWAHYFQLPHEWNEETLDLFLYTKSNHYVCNAAIYGNNLGYWFSHAQPLEFDPNKYLRKQYSETPWQFVLQNPLLGNLKYAKIIAQDIMNSNMIYFCELIKYQELSPEWIQIFTSFIDLTKIHQDYVSRVLNFLMCSSELYGFENLSNTSIEWIINKISTYNLVPELINRLPYDFKLLALKRYTLNQFTATFNQIDLPNNVKMQLLEEYLKQ